MSFVNRLFYSILFTLADFKRRHIPIGSSLYNFFNFLADVKNYRAKQLMPFKLVYINLPERQDRAKFQDEQLFALGYDFQRFEAIRYDLNNPNHQTYVNSQGLHPYLTRNQRGIDRQAGVIGCYLSHLKAIENITDTNGYTLIIEDDLFIFLQRFFRSIESFLSQNIEHDLVVIDPRGVNGIQNIK